MCRVLHVLLVSYALLACPYRCLGSSPVKCAPSEQARSCSCCDRELEAAGTDNGQDTPAPDEPCKCNCLCQGAVLSKDDLPLTADWPALFSAVLPGDLVAASEGTPRLTRDRKPRSAAASGRTLRFALQSLQI